MVTLVANEAITTAHIAYLGSIADTGAANLHAETANGLIVTQGPIDFEFTGYGIHYYGVFPIGGTITGVNIRDHGVSAYRFTNLNVSVPELVSLWQANDPATAFTKLFSGADHFTGSNFADVLAGFGGNDYLNGRMGDDQLAGGPGNDTLFGGGGSDTLRGGLGNDLLSGGVGNDLLVGGPGADRFVFSTLPDTVANSDTIIDFAAGSDKLVLSHAVYAMLPTGTLGLNHFTLAAPVSSAAVIAYDQATGALSYYAHGNGGAGVQFATLANLAALHHADIIVA